MTESHYPAWVCQPCGEQYGCNPSAREFKTWHEGDRCGICGKLTATTEPRDFGHLKPDWPSVDRRPS